MQVQPIQQVLALSTITDQTSTTKTTREVDQSQPTMEYANHIRQIQSTPWYANIVNYLACGFIPKEMSFQQKKKLWSDSKFYFWEESYLFKRGIDDIYRRCIP